VDDSATFLEEVSDQLRQEGYDVVSARSGAEALELLAVQKVDAILLDVVMPGLSGQETCHRIKANPSWRDIPLLMLSGLEEREALLEGINAGADDFITKSARFEVLKARLRAQLRRRQFEDENRGFREQLLRREMEALEVQAVRELADERAKYIDELEKKNLELRRAREAAVALSKELESFSYSVSHDLRAPLRSIDGFSQMLMRKHSGNLDEEGLRLLGVVRASTENMGRLIDDMLNLAKVSRREISFQSTDLSSLARELAAELRLRDPGRDTEIEIQPDLHAKADRGLMRILLENLLGNAWKFTSHTPSARIVFKCEILADGRSAFVVRDNGAGFNMAYAGKLFGVFQRLHSTKDFPGTGVGLATVDRVVRRHGGRIWAEGKEGAGASFYFTLDGNGHTG
jgi:signal transduction histidine kinase